MQKNICDIADIDERRFKQIMQVAKISKAAKNSHEPTGHGSRITCCGTQPSRTSKFGHVKCGNQISVEFAYRCYYCGFYFCERCAAAHFGKSRAEHMAEFTDFDGTE